MSSEITAELIEDLFGKQSDSVRFANFCNSVIIAQSSAMASATQILSEKPGADGGIDAEWTIPVDGTIDFKSPFGSAGWNVFQYKARSIAGDGRKTAFSKLCNDLNGALAKLTDRLTQPKECRQYSLFTNLQLGLETVTKTRDDKLLQKQRTLLKEAIIQGSDGKTLVEIFDAAQLAAIVNAHPALRLTYFSGPIAKSWNDSWATEQRVKDYKVAVSLVGRNQELNRVGEWLRDTAAKVIVLCGPSGMGKTRLALEATRPFAFATTIVEVVDELMRTDFQALGASKSTSFMRSLELLALKEIEHTGQVKETKLFCECFVDWYHDFPMSYQERGAWVERLLKSENRTHRLLGANVVAFVTEPPQSLSGYAGGTARRLGQTPPQRMWKEIFDYMARLVEFRFELTQSADKKIAEIAQNEFGASISQLIGHVSPDQLVAIMERMTEWTFAGKLSVDVRRLRTAIHWIEERYTASSKNAGQEQFSDQWAAVLNRIAHLRDRFDGGDFLLRLKIATGDAFEYEWDPGQEGRVYGYQKRLRALAAEAANNPALMNAEAWSVLKDPNAQHSGEFIKLLGECDHQKQFIKQFESEIGDHPGNWRFGPYCFGLNHSDPAFVENYLNGLANESTIQKGSLLWPIRFIGPTPMNRKRLLQFVAQNSVAPIEVANMFTAGKWLDDLPVSEVLTIMQFIAQGDKWPEWAAAIMNLYLHPNKAMPTELIPFAEQILQEIEETYDNAYKCNEIGLGIAKTDLEKGFSILEKQIIILNNLDLRNWRAVWNPFRLRGGNEFWNYLRSQNPERAYRCFCALKNRHVLNDISNENSKALFDLENHRSILLKIAKENEGDAEQIADSVSIKQPGFFPFAFEILLRRPIDGKVASNLSSTIVERFGFGPHLDKLQAALQSIEAQLQNPKLPDHGRAWLERLKFNIQEAIKASPWNSGDHEFLGWS